MVARKIDPIEAARLYRDGLTAREIGERFGVTANPVYIQLAKLGVKRRVFKYDEKAIAKLYRSGLSLRQCARVVGCRDMTVIAALRRAKCPTRKKGEGLIIARASKAKDKRAALAAANARIAEHRKRSHRAKPPTLPAGISRALRSEFREMAALYGADRARVEIIKMQREAAAP